MKAPFASAGARWRRCLSLLALLAPGVAEIYFYDDVELPNERLIYRESGMFAPGDAPYKGPPGDGMSFIKLTDLQFTKAWDTNCDDPAAVAAGTAQGCDSTTGAVDIVVFERSKFGAVGFQQGTDRYYCCTDTAMMVGACATSSLGRLILPDPDMALHARHLEVSNDRWSSLVRPSEGIAKVDKTGMYIVLIANCDPRAGIVAIEGHTEWLNPYGYLPGEVYGCLPFFLWLSGIYLVLGAAWTIACFCHTRDLLAVQLWVSAVVLLGMAETCAKYFDYRGWNEDGTRHTGVLVFAILMGAAKRALSRVLVLMISMGYGLVKPSLGRDLHRILLLGGMYLITSVTYDLAASLPAADAELSNPAFVDGVAVLIFLVSTIDVIFYLWILQAIGGTLHMLELKRQGAKLRLYSQFRLVLLASVCFSIAWGTFGLVQSSGDRMETAWRLDWAVNAVWEVLYLFVLLSTCLLLRPSRNNQRYAHSYELPDVEEADDGTNTARKPGDRQELLGEDDDAEFGGPTSDGEDEFVVQQSRLHHGNGRNGAHAKPSKQNVD